MGWDAAFVGEIRVDPKRFAALERGVCATVTVDGLSALSPEPVEPRSISEILAALQAPATPQWVVVERDPKKGTISCRGVVDEDTFRRHLPALTQLFAHAVKRGAEAKLTMFGLESDDDLAHELAVEGKRVSIRPIAKKTPLRALRAQLAKKLATQAPALHQPVRAGAPVAIHPSWTTRARFADLRIAYRADAKKMDLEVEVTTERPHDANQVVLAVLGFTDCINAGLFGGDRFAPSAGKARVKEQPTGKGKKSRVVLDVAGVEPIAIRVLIETLAQHLASFGCARLSIASGGKGTPELDAPAMDRWLAEPFAFPHGPRAFDFVVDDLEPPAKGARIVLESDALPRAQPLFLGLYGVVGVLARTPDPHGASRSALVPPIYAYCGIPTVTKAKTGTLEVTYSQWSGEATLARGLFCAAFQRLHSSGTKVRRASFALP